MMSLVSSYPPLPSYLIATIVRLKILTEMIAGPSVVVLLEGCVQTRVDSHLKIFHVRGQEEKRDKISSVLERRYLKISSPL